MMECEITCLCSSLRLPDLGITLDKGQVAYLPADKARQSKDLARARRVNGVAVREIQRVREQKVPPPPVEPQRTARPFKGLTSQMTPEAQEQVKVQTALLSAAPPVVKPPVDVEGIAAKIGQALRAEMKEAMQEALKGGLPMASSSRAPASAPTPTFIPTGIVKEGKADFTVESQSTESGGVDAAAKALKGRGKRSKKAE